jgi:hypothetical protein
VILSSETVAERFLGALDVSWHHGQATAIALVVATLLAGALLHGAGARASAAGREEAPLPRGPLATMLGGAFLVVVALVLSRFRFIEDDYFQLVRAEDLPWQMDDSLRLVSGTVLYGVGRRVGAGWFIAVNLAVWVGSTGLWLALLRRAGWARDEATIAASLYGLAPGNCPLARSGIGFQTSASILLWFAILILVDEAARTRTEERARRAGLLALALGLTGAGVFVKYPMVAGVPLFAWAWGRTMVRRAAPPLAGHAFYGVFAAAALIPLALAHEADPQAGELEKAGVGRFVTNVLELLGRLWSASKPLVMAGAILVAFVAIEARPRGFTPAREAVRGAVAAASARVRPIALLAAIGAAPFLLNRRYFAPYYVVPCWTFVAAIAAVPLAALARRTRHLAASALAAFAVVPLADAARTFDRRVENDPTPLLEAARRATASVPAPCGVVLAAQCSTEEATAASARDLAELFDRTEGAMGVRWATGWHGAEVAVLGARGAVSASCAAPLTLRYCAGEGMRLDGPPR